MLNMTSRLFAQLWSRSWYRQSRTANAAAVEFVPGPQLTPEQVEQFAEPTGRAARWARWSYLAVWVAQIAAAVTVVAAVAALVSGIVAGVERKTSDCRAGAAGCARIAVPVAGPVLVALICTAVVVVGRTTRRKLAELMRSSAARDARSRRGPLLPAVVLLGPLPARSQWLLTTADRMLGHFPPALADRVLWDIARRLDAAAALGRLGTDDAAEIAQALNRQAEADVDAIRSAVTTESSYRHRPCRVSSRSSLPRAGDTATLLRDARLLLPRDGADDHQGLRT